MDGRRELGSNCAVEMVARFRIFGTAKERGKVGLTAAAALAVGVARVSIGSLCASSDFRSSEQAQVGPAAPMGARKLYEPTLTG